jgi:hypothetical protein
MRADEGLGRRHHRREAALHVGRAAPVEHAVLDDRHERIARQSSSGPVGTTSVCPAKQNTGPSRPRFAQKFVDRPERQILDLKAEPLAAVRSAAPGSRRPLG